MPRGFVVCRKGPVMFSIERADFRRVDLEGGEDLDEAVRERVLAPVAETVAADLPDG